MRRRLPSCPRALTAAPAQTAALVAPQPPRVNPWASAPREARACPQRRALAARVDQRRARAAARDRPARRRAHGARRRHRGVGPRGGAGARAQGRDGDRAQRPRGAAPGAQHPARERHRAPRRTVLPREHTAFGGAQPAPRSLRPRRALPTRPSPRSTLALQTLRAHPRGHLPSVERRGVTCAPREVARLLDREFTALSPKPFQQGTVPPDRFIMPAISRHARWSSSTTSERLLIQPEP